MMTTPTSAKPSTARPLALTGKGNAAALLIRVLDRWEQLSPSQQAECGAILERLAVALRREHSVCQRGSAASPGHAGVTVRQPLLEKLLDPDPDPAA